MKPDGNDVADAIKQWMKSELKKSPQKKYDLGKFFFGVSSSTLGIIITIEKFSNTPLLDFTLTIAILFFIVSILVALIMVLPKLINITGDVDLFELHRNSIKYTLYQIYLWFIIWTIGIIFGIIAILN
jgi:hypothetical protein